MLEIIVASVILALVIAGTANVFISSRRFMAQSRERINEGELGKYVLDPLQMDVNASTWDQAGNQLTVGTRSQSKTINGKSYNFTYNVSQVAGTDLRKVEVTCSNCD